MSVGRLAASGAGPLGALGGAGCRRMPGRRCREEECQERRSGTKRRREAQDVETPETPLRGVSSKELLARGRGVRQVGASSSEGTGSTA